jgi:hypothetical protein
MEKERQVALGRKEREVVLEHVEGATGGLLQGRRKFHLWATRSLR